MRLETFFEKFELFAEAPNAVAKMRELVLHLAVQGALIPQDPSDETADALLERITSTARVGRRGTEGSEGFDQPFQLPSNWTWVRLPRVLDKLTDGTHHSPPNSSSGDFMYVTAKNIKTDGIKLDGITFVSKEVHDEIHSRCNPSFGDVLYIKDGATTGIATINQIKEPFSMLSSVALLKPSKAIFNRYLLWAMRSPFFYEETRGSMKGAAITRVTLSVMASSLLPLPPLAEQKRIAAKVDELMALCDRLEAQEQERDTRRATLARASLSRFAEAPTPANLDFLFHQSYPITPAELRKAILSLAVQGKLVGSLKDSSSWPVVRMRDVCIQITDGEHATPQRTSSGVPLATAKNVRDGFLDLSITDWVAPKTAEKCWKRCKPRHEDLLMVCVGATTGRVCLVQNPPDMVLVRSVALIRPNQERIDPTYLDLFLRSPGGQSQIWSNVKQSAQPCLYLGKMSEFEIVLPPLAEQRRIVAKVDQLMALVDQLETQLAESKAKSAALLDTVIHELLNPTAEIVDLAAYRVAIGCYAIRKMHDKPYFGRTTAAKVLYLAQAHVGLELGWQPMRKTAGPLDEWIYDFEREAAGKDWFRHSEKMIASGNTKVTYQPGRMLAEPCAQAGRLLLTDQQREFDRLLGLFADRTTKEVEIIATLFAAWNDFLIDGHSPSDDEIVTEVRENWHVSKAQFEPSLLRQWLGWLRQNNLIPQGRLPHTLHQQQLSLN